MAKTNKGRKLFATTATAALVASAIVPVASAAQVNDFNSISSYAQEAVQSLVDRGVVQGDAKGNFNPRNSVTRAEAATILVGALDLDATGSINFTDVKAGAWYYDAINAAVNNDVFQGQGAGKFNPSGNLTRSEAAIILVNAFGLEGSGDLSEFSDASSVKTWAKEALEIAVANGVMKGDNGKLNPNANITKQDFAVMFYRTEVLEAAPVTGAVKAINNTTVEVTFEEVVADVNALKFTIDGLEVTNAVVKQTDSKTVVLTTAAQTADTTYKVSVDGKEVGSFKGVSAVIPTAVKTVVASQQGVIGKEVTLSAEVTVAEGQSKAGIPVTFNIVNDKSTNGKIEVEAITDDKGVATYSYTRYYNGIDEVVAYATSKSSVKDNAKVYWASSTQLTIKEAKEGNTVANGSKKTYEINGAKNSVVFVAFEENLNIKSNKIAEIQVTSAVGSIDEKGKYTPYTGSKGLTPYELSTGAAQYVVVELDKNGKGSLILTGSDDSVTPIVYEATSIGDLDLDELDEVATVKKANVAYGKTLLQDKAATVKFEQNDKLALDVKALGTEDAAQADVLPANLTEIDEENDFGFGGREYEVTVKTKDGELASAGSKAYVKLTDYKNIENIRVIADGVARTVTKDTVLALTVGKEGKASFRVIGKGKETFATPTVFLNTEGSTSTPALDKKDVQVEAETTYFTEAEVKEAVIKVLNAPFGAEVASLQATKKAYAVYQSVDQNGFAYGTGKKYDVTFELSTTFGELKVTGEDVQNVGRTYTYETTSDENGRAVVEFYADSATTVDIDILGSRNVLPAKVATVKFTQYATGETTGVVAAYNTTNRTLTIGTNVYSYADAKEFQEKGSKITRSEFEALIAKPNARVSITKDADGKLTFNVLEALATPGTGSVATQLTNAATDAEKTAILASAYPELTTAQVAALLTPVKAKALAGTLNATNLQADYDALFVTVTAAKALDTNNDGKADQIKITFGEATTGAVATYIDTLVGTSALTLSGATISGTGTASGNDLTYTVTDTDLAVGTLTIAPSTTAAVTSTPAQWLVGKTLAVAPATYTTPVAIGVAGTNAQTPGTNATFEEFTVTPVAATANGTATLGFLASDVNTGSALLVDVTVVSGQTAISVGEAFKAKLDTVAAITAKYDVSVDASGVLTFKAKTAGAYTTAPTASITGAATGAYASVTSGANATAEINAITFAGTVTTGGNVTVTVGDTSVVTLVATGDTATIVAGKVYDQLRVTSAITDKFTVTIDGAAVKLTNKTTGVVTTAITVAP